MDAALVNASIIVATTGGVIGGAIWLLKFLVQRAIEQIDSLLSDHSNRIDRTNLRIQEIAERVAVLVAGLETTRKDLLAAHNKIRALERLNVP
jgi:hypothetical protein